MLDVRCRIVPHAFPVPKIGTELDDRTPRTKARAEQPVLVQLLEPLGIVHVGLAPRHVFDMTGVHEQDLKSGLFENLENGNPVHSR